MTMMRNVSTGDPLIIPANTYNTFIDAVREFQKRIKPGQKLTQLSQRGMIWLCNDTPIDCWQHFVLGVDESVYEPHTIIDTEGSFVDQIALKGWLFDLELHLLWVCIRFSKLILADNVGLAMIQGICHVRVVITDRYISLSWHMKIFLYP